MKRLLLIVFLVALVTIPAHAEHTVIYFSGDEETYTTLDNTAAANVVTTHGKLSTQLTSTDHGFKANSSVYISGTTNYDGMHEIIAVAANTLDVPVSFLAETPAGTETVTAAFLANGQYQVISYELHNSSAPTTSENLVVSIDAKKGAAFDTVIDTKDMETVADYYRSFEQPLLLESGDVLKFVWDNTDNRTWGISLKVRKIQ